MLTGFGRSDAPLVNWIGVQSIPPMLPPYFAGSAKSKLIGMLEKGHNGVMLSPKEMETLSCWIDLLVPFCGDYTEAAAWAPADSSRYDHYLQKRRRFQESEQAAIADLIAARHGGVASVRTRILDAAGNVVQESRAFRPGDRIEIAGPPRMRIRIGTLPECLVYSPEGRIEFQIPEGADAKAYDPAAYSGEHPVVSARPATMEEIGAYGNLALNPYDSRGISTSFPHASSNSECREEAVFAARNAIDGSKVNTKHGGWPNQSWGPDRRTDTWWKVDFGRAVQVDKLTIILRADFPHDKTWTSATVRFSDGSTQKITLQKTAEPQSFSFDKRTVSWVQLEELAGEKPLGWCALSEVEVFGREDRAAR